MPRLRSINLTPNRSDRLLGTWRRMQVLVLDRCLTLAGWCSCHVMPCFGPGEEDRRYIDYPTERIAQIRPYVSLIPVEAASSRDTRAPLERVIASVDPIGSGDPVSSANGPRQQPWQGAPPASVRHRQNQDLHRRGSTERRSAISGSRLMEADSAYIPGVSLISKELTQASSLTLTNRIRIGLTLADEPLPWREGMCRKGPVRFRVGSRTVRYLFIHRFRHVM